MESESDSVRGRRPTVTRVPFRPSAGERASCDPVAKPTVAELGVDPTTLDWQRSGPGPGSFEVAFIAGETRSQPETTDPSVMEMRNGGTARSIAAEWVLLRVADDPAGRVLVYDRNEWLCFLDGAAHDEFDWPQGLARGWSVTKIA